MPSSEYTPTRADVGAIIRARTRGGTHGQTELGTFDTTTRPTGAEMDALISLSVSDVATRLGEDLPSTSLKNAAKSLAAVRAAMRAELSYYPEQLDSDQSPYRALKEMWDEGMKSLVEAVAEAGGGGGGESVATPGGGLPSYAFPPDAGGLVGWQSNW